MRLPVTEKFLWDLYNLLYRKDSGNRRGWDIFDPYLLPKIVLRGGHIDLLERNLYTKYRKKYGSERFSKFVYYLKKKGYIEAKSWQTRKALVLTARGFEKISTQHAKRGLIKRDDGKWEMVIFDIPEQSRGLRDKLRVDLKLLGYKQLQQSVWVSPYQVEEQTQKIIRSSNLEDRVKIFLVELVQDNSHIF